MTAHPMLRPATEADAEAISDLYLASRKYFLPYVPLAHSDESVRQWISTYLIPNTDVQVACFANRIVGLMVLARDEHSGWIDQLYLHPDVVDHGIGTRLVSLAKARLGAPIRLYTFQANHRARRFYERHGFVAIAFSDGSQNEEHCPDVLYEWRPAMERKKREQ